VAADLSAARPERRRTPRVRADDVVSARVRPGRQVRIIDLSAGGALIETSHRLLPGTRVELHVERSDRSIAVRGSVLRCAVSHVQASSLSYRGAIGFDRHLPWFVDEGAGGYSVHTSENRSGQAFRGETTPQVI